MSLKPVLKLVAEQHIFPVLDYLNSLFHLKNEDEFHFEVAQSTSRPREKNSSYDIRNKQPIQTNHPLYQEILNGLQTLKERGLINYEIKYNEENNQCTFTITDCAYPEILNATPIATLESQQKQIDSAEVKTIRYASFNIHCRYLSVHSLQTKKIKKEEDDLEQLGGAIEILSVTEAVPNAGRSSELALHIAKNCQATLPSAVIDLIAAQENMDPIKKQLNSFFGLSEENGFFLYCQSSSHEYPIDLRVTLKVNDPRVESVKSKISGLVAKDAIIAEESDDAEYKTFIIKKLNKTEISYPLVDGVDSDPAHIQEVIALFQQAYPEYSDITSLFINFDGSKLSATKPYNHIRTQKFVGMNLFFDGELTTLHNQDLILFDLRPYTGIGEIETRTSAYNPATKTAVAPIWLRKYVHLKKTTSNFNDTNVAIPATSSTRQNPETIKQYIIVIKDFVNLKNYLIKKIEENKLEHTSIETESINKNNKRLFSSKPTEIASVNPGFPFQLGSLFTANPKLPQPNASLPIEEESLPELEEVTDKKSHIRFIPIQPTPSPLPEGAKNKNEPKQESSPFIWKP